MTKRKTQLYIHARALLFDAVGALLIFLETLRIDKLAHLAGNTSYGAGEPLGNEGLDVGNSPRQETSELYWLAQVAHDEHVALEDGGSLDGVECGLSVSVGEPPDPKVYHKSWDYAHGFIDWFGGDKPCLISLRGSAETFAPLRELAERGSLPSVHITFKDDCGIEFGASPDGNAKIWHNKHALFCSTFLVIASNISPL
jgi:hypothetical protein